MRQGMKKIIPYIFLITTLLALLTGCGSDNIQEINITNGGRLTLEVGSTVQLKLDIPDELLSKVQWESSSDAATVSDTGTVKAVEVGTAAITAKYKDLSDTAIIEVVSESLEYDDSEKEAFYQNYTVASSYEEAMQRSTLGLMSGSLTVSDQAPVISQFQPRANGMLVRNNEPYFADENTYIVVDCYGEEVLRVYRGGAYISLEEVAAYVYAFGDVPANYTDSKNMEPENSIWGEYLRLNHSAFSGNTKKYPYEPELPDISGCGGELYYYEIDIGTTGTDCDPAYISKIYNNGQTITRGAARIVYARYDRNKNGIIDPNEKYVFYTYNHYNDFREYLNYYGGWGEMFGNVTGGGVLSSKTNCNPTPYVPVFMGSLTSRSSAAIVVPVAWIERRFAKELLAAKKTDRVEHRPKNRKVCHSIFVICYFIFCSNE